MNEVLTAGEMLARLRAAVKAAGGQAKWAAKHCISERHLMGVVNLGHEPSAAVLRALTLRPLPRTYELAPDAS